MSSNTRWWARWWWGLAVVLTASLPAHAGSGTLSVSSVTDQGGGTYLVSVTSTTGMTVGDHFGARTGASAGGGLWAVATIPGATSFTCTDTLTEENGGAFGVPYAGGAGSGWYSTPVNGLSRIPHRAIAYDAALRRNAYLTQLLDADLTAIGALAKTDGNVIVGDGSTWVAESGATARTSLGLGSIATQAADAVSISGGSITGITDLAVADGGTGASTAADARTNLGLGTIATQSAASVAITGGSVTGITDLAVADGGTGASTAADARTALGLAIGTDVQAFDADLTTIGGLAKADGNIIVGDGAAWTVESGATARTSLGVAIGSDVQAHDPDLAELAAIANVRGDLIVTDSTPSHTRLAVGAANTLLRSDGTDPAWATLSAAIDAAAGSTQGNILYRNDTVWTVLAPGTAGQVLTSGGAAANPSWTTISVGDAQSVLWDATTAANSGGGEDDLRTHSLAGGTLAADGDYVEIETWGTHDAGAGTIIMRLYFGATVLVATPSYTPGGAGSWWLRGVVVRTGATTQAATAWGQSNTATTQARLTTSTTPGATLSGAVTIKTTAEASSAVVATQRGFIIRKWSAP